MIKSKPYIHVYCLSLLMVILFTTNVHSIPIGGITKILKGFGKGTNLIKPGSKIATPGVGDDILKRINKSEVSTDLNSNNLLNKNSSHDDILSAHGVRKFEKVVDGKDLVEMGSDNLIGDNNDGVINTIRVVWWSGRVFRVSDVFNKPQLDERLIIECQTDSDVFTFTALLSNEINNSLEKKAKNWFLLSQHFPNAQVNKDGSIIIKKGSYNKVSMAKQELLVLEDNDDYIIFSNKIAKDQQYPTNYFIISSNARFVHKTNINGIESPEYIKNTANDKIKKSNFNCLKRNI
jgi:hypothetical protein